MTTAYDPDIAPDPQAWLALDEPARIQLAAAFHQAQGIELPSLRAHAAFHAIVETQIAEGRMPAIRAVARLRREGLTRHDAVHAVGSVLAELLHKVAAAKGADKSGVSTVRYNAALERLTAKRWLRRYGD